MTRSSKLIITLLAGGLAAWATLAPATVTPDEPHPVPIDPYIRSWQLAPGRTSIEFKIKHLVVMEVKGKFKKFEGNIVTTNQDFSTALVEVSIPVASIHTGNQDRDTHLLGDGFFGADEYPHITFTSTEFIKTGEDTYTISGNLTIRDVTRPIELSADYSGQKLISGGKTRADFAITGSLNRFDYGLRWNEVSEAGRVLVGETVTLTMNIALIEED